MKEEISLDIKMSKEEIGRIRDILGNAKGLRHYAIQLNNGDYLDLVEYKDFQHLESNWKELKNWMNSEMERFEDNPYTRLGIAVFTRVLDKMQELESGNNEYN